MPPAPARPSVDEEEREKEEADGSAAGTMLYFIQIIISKNIDTVILYTAEIRRLKSEIAELRTRCSQLENTTVNLSRQVKN